MGNMNRKLTRAEMIVLVDKIRRTEGTKEEVDAIFIANCQHPSGSDLIFWPHGFPHNRKLPEPTTEEIVDKALDPGSVIKL